MGPKDEDAKAEIDDTDKEEKTKGVRDNSILSRKGKGSVYYD